MWMNTFHHPGPIHLPRDIVFFRVPFIPVTVTYDAWQLSQSEANKTRSVYD